MERQVHQMTRMVDELLEVSRIGRGKISLQTAPLDLAEVVATAVETSRPLVEARRHTLTVSLPERPARVEADGARLAQVLSNLLNNAAKYTEDGGRIDLIVEQAQAEVVIRVRDNGIGMAPERLTSVFDMFEQIEGAADRSQGGLGIGLTLARRAKSNCTAARSRLTAMGWGRVASSLRACPRSPSRRPSRPQSPRRSPSAVRHGRAAACWSWTTMWIRRRAWPCCCGSTAMTSGFARRRGRSGRGARLPARRDVSGHRPAEDGRL